MDLFLEIQSYISRIWYIYNVNMYYKVFIVYLANEHSVN